MAEYVSTDYPSLAKGGFALGVALFLAGALGQAALGQLPQWEQTLLFDLEIIGLLVGFFSPFVFGIALPLIE